MTSNIYDILLHDQTTNRNIIWACSDYGFDDNTEITPNDIPRIVPRYQKNKDDQKRRTKNKGEVFTPGWVCKAQNDLIDDAWYGVHNGDDWQSYVSDIRLEITCGEGAYLVSRYDAVSGEPTPIDQRIGLLDRKLRAISDNVNDEQQWLVWAACALQSVYGFDWQGDNVFLARQNVLFSANDFYKAKFKKEIDNELLCAFAEIVSWNIWQMDGLKFVVPMSCMPTIKKDIFGNEKQCECEGCKRKDARKHNGIYCLVKDWTNDKTIRFVDLMNQTKENHSVLVNAIVGNPPYQKMDGGGGSSAKPVYNLFVEAAKELNPDYISMVMPARWMTCGKGLDEFRKAMIEDKRISKLYDFADSSELFSNVSITGGVCYFLRGIDEGECDIYRKDANGTSHSRRYLKEGDDDIFIRHLELLSIKNKVQAKGEPSFKSIVSSTKPYGLQSGLFADPAKYGLPPLSNESFGENGYSILGLENTKRTNKYVPLDYPLPKREGLDKYKVFISKGDGAAGEIGNPIPARILGRAVVGQKGELCTETFLQIGGFDTEAEAEACVKYIYTQFFRALVGIKKQTQSIAQDVYQFVPLQSFSCDSDIDWLASIDAIDEQLFDKYQLTQAERDFITAMVGKMK